MIDYLQRRLERDQYFLFNEKKRLFLIASERERRIVANEYFSAAYETAFMDGCKLAFGKPSDLLIF